MALVVSDRVKETTTSTGTGTLNLGGAANAFETFVAGVGDGNTTYYAIIDTVNGDFEVGLGTVTDATPDTLSRDTVLESSNSDNKVNFSAGTKTVICTQPADKAVYLDSSGNLVVNGSAVNYLDKSGGTMTGALTLSGAPTNANHAVTKTYVDDLIAAGIHYHTPVRVESPDSEGNLNATYDNGTSGVGATLTNAGTQAALVIDGVTLVVNDRVLIYNQTDATENGIYTVTNVGSASTNWVLTRATDADSYGVDNDSLSEGTSVFVLEGDDGSGEVYGCTTTGTITFGTTNIEFAQIGRSAVISGGTGITVSDNTVSVTDNSIGATQLNVSGDGDTTKFLRSDGDGSFSWVVPTDTNTVPNNATICICTAGCLTGGGTFTVDQSAGSTVTVCHVDTSTLSGNCGGNNNGVVIEDITVDGYGHVTAIGTRDLDGRFDCYSSWTISDGTNSEAINSGNTLTVCGSGASSVAYDTATNTLTVSSTDTNTDTNTTYGLTAEQTGGTNANPNLVLDGSSGTDSCVQIVGSGATTVTRNCDGKITISSTDTNTDTNTTYSLCAAQTGGNNTNPNLFLDGSAGTDSCLQLAGSGATTVTRNCDGKITISSTDTNTNTTYTAGCGLTLNGTEFDANVSATQQTTGANAVTSTASRTYAVQVDGSDNLVVNVPWSDTDTDTTYTAGTNLCLNGTQFNVCGTVPTATSASCATGAVFNATCVDATNVYASAVLETALIQSNDYSCNVCDITIQPGRSLYVAPNAGASIFCCVNGATNVVCLDCGVNLCVGGGQYSQTSSAKIHGPVCSQGFVAHQFHDLAGCNNYVHLCASESYSIDNWFLEGVGNGIISTCSANGIRFQIGHGALFQPYMYDMSCTCHDFYVCSTGVGNGIKAKICNTGLCVDGCVRATNAICGGNNSRLGIFQFDNCHIGFSTTSAVCMSYFGNLCAQSSYGRFVIPANTGGGTGGLTLCSGTNLCMNNYALPTSDGTAGQVICTNGSGTLGFTTPSSGQSVCVVSGCYTCVNSVSLVLLEGWKEIDFVVQADCFSASPLVDFSGYNEPIFQSTSLLYNNTCYLPFCYSAINTYTTTSNAQRCYSTSDLSPDMYFDSSGLLRYRFWKVPVGSSPTCYRILMEASYNSGDHTSNTSSDCRDMVFLQGSSTIAVNESLNCCWSFCVGAGSRLVYVGAPTYYCNVTYYNHNVEYALKTIV